MINIFGKTAFRWMSRNAGLEFHHMTTSRPAGSFNSRTINICTCAVVVHFTMSAGFSAPTEKTMGYLDLIVVAGLRTHRLQLHTSSHMPHARTRTSSIRYIAITQHKSRVLSTHSNEHNNNNNRKTSKMLIVQFALGFPGTGACTVYSCINLLWRVKCFCKLMRELCQRGILDIREQYNADVKWIELVESHVRYTCLRDEKNTPKNISSKLVNNSPKLMRIQTCTNLLHQAHFCSKCWYIQVGIVSILSAYAIWIHKLANEKKIEYIIIGWSNGQPIREWNPMLWNQL